MAADHNSSIAELYMMKAMDKHVQMSIAQIIKISVIRLKIIKFMS